MCALLDDAATGMRLLCTPGAFKLLFPPLAGPKLTGATSLHGSDEVPFGRQIAASHGSLQRMYIGCDIVPDGLLSG